MANHCQNLTSDRDIGAYWEREFAKMAARYGKVFSLLQVGRSTSAVFYAHNEKWNTYTLPDVTIWSSPGEHHEIKHKNPTSRGAFGLEVYRFNALLYFAQVTQSRVMYTIHNHDLSGGRDARINNIDHWITVDVTSLNGAAANRVPMASWVNGQKKEVPTYFWPSSLWTPLKRFWENQAQS